MRFDILLKRIRPDSKWKMDDLHVRDYDRIHWLDENTTLPTYEEFEIEWNSYVKEHKLQNLRQERDNILSQTDKYAILDWPHPSEEVKQAWLDYRQALRDLPANTTDPENPVWPTPPE